jgi:hypothetical protein
MATEAAATIDKAMESLQVSKMKELKGVSLSSLAQTLPP